MKQKFIKHWPHWLILIQVILTIWFGLYLKISTPSNVGIAKNLSQYRDSNTGHYIFPNVEAVGETISNRNIEYANTIDHSQLIIVTMLLISWPVYLFIHRIQPKVLQNHRLQTQLDEKNNSLNTARGIIEELKNENNLLNQQISIEKGKYEKLLQKPQIVHCKAWNIRDNRHLYVQVGNNHNVVRVDATLTPKAARFVEILAQARSNGENQYLSALEVYALFEDYTNSTKKPKNDREKKQFLAKMAREIREKIGIRLFQSVLVEFDKEKDGYRITADRDPMLPIT